MKIKNIFKSYLALLLCICFAAPICFAESGNFEAFLQVTSESGFAFVPYDSDGVISGAATATSQTDMHFGLGESYYTMSMSKGYPNGMTMESSAKSGSLQDATSGANFTAEVSFDVSVDAAASANPIQIRFFPQDKGGTVHKGNSVTKMSLTPKADGTRMLTVYDRSGKTALGEVNLTEVLGAYANTNGHFFRFRYVFQSTDASGAMRRSQKVYVDGKEVISATYLNNTKEYRIAGIGIQRAVSNYGAIDNLVFAQYNGERKDSTGKDVICDDALVAAIRKSAILIENAEDNPYINSLKTAVSAAKAGYQTMQTQSACDALTKELENAMKTYSDSVTMDQFVISEFTKENPLYITQNMTFPASFLPASGGVYDCAVTADKSHVISADGTVTRPKYNETVTLTANLTRDTDFSAMQKTFSVRVLADGTVAKLGDITSYTKSFTPKNRVLLGGYTKDTAAEISFGENKAAVSANSEFSVVCDYSTKEFILYQNGAVVKTSDLIGTPKSYTVSGNVYDAVFVSNDSAGYDVRKLQFESPDGDPRTIPVSEGFVSGAELICKDETISHADVFAAIYEGNRLFSVSRGQITQKHGYNETFSVSFSQAILPQDIKEITVKLLFVNNSQSLKPIIPAYTYVAKEEINFNPVVYVAGDSTACNYGNSSFPQTGWGQVLGNFFTDEVTVENHAMGGRSAKSFMDEGRLDTIFSKIQPGDYLLIQFGHNDQKVYDVDPYREYLKVYIEGARDLGAIPILLTSVTRRIYKNGVYDQGASLGKFPKAAREVAAQLDVPLIETFDFTVNLVNTLGEEGSKDIFLHLVQNDERFVNDSRFANSKYNKQAVTEDNSHFQYYGAEVIAAFVAEELSKLNLSLTPYYKPYTPVKP